MRKNAPRSCTAVTQCSIRWTSGRHIFLQNSSSCWPVPQMRRGNILSYSSLQCNYRHCRHYRSVRSLWIVSIYLYIHYTFLYINVLYMGRWWMMWVCLQKAISDRPRSHPLHPTTTLMPWICLSIPWPLKVHHWTPPQNSESPISSPEGTAGLWMVLGPWPRPHLSCWGNRVTQTTISLHNVPQFMDVAWEIVGASYPASGIFRVNVHGHGEGLLQMRSGFRQEQVKNILPTCIYIGIFLDTEVYTVHICEAGLEQSRIYKCPKQSEGTCSVHRALLQRLVLFQSCAGDFLYQAAPV